MTDDKDKPDSGTGQETSRDLSRRGFIALSVARLGHCGRDSCVISYRTDHRCRD